MSLAEKAKTILEIAENFRLACREKFISGTPFNDSEKWVLLADAEAVLAKMARAHDVDCGRLQRAHEKEVEKQKRLAEANSLEVLRVEIENENLRSELAKWKNAYDDACFDCQRIAEATKILNENYPWATPAVVNTLTKESARQLCLDFERQLERLRGALQK